MSDSLKDGKGDKEAKASEEEQLKQAHDHIAEHTSRLETLEKHLGIKHKPDGMKDETDAERRHRERGERDARLAKRKRT